MGLVMIVGGHVFLVCEIFLFVFFGGDWFLDGFGATSVGWNNIPS